MSIWLALKADGTILTAHCDCMAGACEACSHVAATLFFISKASEMSSTCTSLPCAWNRPSSKIVDYAEGVNVSFAKPKVARMEPPSPQSPAPPSAQEAVRPGSPPVTPMIMPLMPQTPSSQIPATPSSTPDGNRGQFTYPPRTPDAIQMKQEQHKQQNASEFYSRTAASNSRPVLLAYTQEHSDAFVPLTRKMKLPKPLSNLCDEHFQECQHLTFPDILKRCDEIFASLAFTADQVTHNGDITCFQTSMYAYDPYTYRSSVLRR